MINLPLVLTYLLVAFIVMKVAGVIDWSWWAVISPLYIPLGFVLGLITFTVSAWVRIKMMTPEQRKRHEAAKLMAEFARRFRSR